MIKYYTITSCVNPIPIWVISNWPIYSICFFIKKNTVDLQRKRTVTPSHQCWKNVITETLFHQRIFNHESKRKKSLLSKYITLEHIATGMCAFTINHLQPITSLTVSPMIIAHGQILTETTHIYTIQYINIVRPQENKRVSLYTETR